MLLKVFKLFLIVSFELENFLLKNLQKQVFNHNFGLKLKKITEINFFLIILK